MHQKIIFHTRHLVCFSTLVSQCNSVFTVSSWRSAEHGQVVWPVWNIGTVRSCHPGCVVTIAIAEQHVVLVLVSFMYYWWWSLHYIIECVFILVGWFFLSFFLLCRVYQPSWNVCTQVTGITAVRFLAGLAGMLSFLAALAGMLRFLAALAGMLRFLAALAGI